MTAPVQYPKVRALTVCLACGGGKSAGLLVCWPCHNDLSVAHEHGYGMIMDRVIQVIDAQLTKRDHEVVIRQAGTGG